MHYTDMHAAAASKSRPDYVQDQWCDLIFPNTTKMDFQYIRGTIGDGTLWRKGFKSSHRNARRGVLIRRGS